MFINILSQLLILYMVKKRRKGRPRLNDEEKASFTTKLSKAVRVYLKQKRLKTEKSYNSTLMRILGLVDEDLKYDEEDYPYKPVKNK